MQFSINIFISSKSIYNFDSLRLRRNKLILIFLFKLLNYKISSAYMLSKHSLTAQNILTFVTNRFFISKMITNTRKFSLILNMCRLYNAQNPETSDIFIFGLTSLLKSSRPEPVSLLFFLLYFSLFLFYFILLVMNLFLFYLSCVWFIISERIPFKYHSQYKK